MKKPRAGGFHVKTGCKTCKIRHVKCDEEKPICNKCRSTGRICDGYDTKQSPSKPPPDKRTQLFPVDTTIKALRMISGPTLSISGTNQERRSFAFFCYQTGQQLSTALNITKTHQLILQASHCDESVRSAVIALGSIGERLSINKFLTRDNEQANACHEFALLQYHKALRRLRERISDDCGKSADLAIIVCFLFTVFEFLQGNDTASLIHLRSGLNILRRDQGSLPSGLQKMVAPSQDPLMHEILRIFSVMDMQATVWLGLQTFQAPNMIPLEGPDDNGLAHPDRFSTLDEASEFLNRRIVATYCFRRLAAAHDSGTSEAHAEKANLLSHLEKWSMSLDALTRTLGRTLTTEHTHRITVLLINHESNLLLLTASPPSSSPAFSTHHTPSFRKIVALAKSLIHSVPTPDLERIVAANNKDDARPDGPILFTFPVGVIQPLYFAAIECPAWDVRREAIALLSSAPWREGAWDSVSMAKIAARRVQEIEGEVEGMGSAEWGGCGLREHVLC